MKKLLVLLLVLLLVICACIAITPLLISEPGYISIAMDGMIYELTVYAAVFRILFTFLIVVFLFVLLRGGFRISLGTWNKFAFASKRRGIKDYNKGVAAYILEDYVQAEHLLAKGSEPAQRERTGYLLASSAASKQSLRSNTQHYLGLLDNIGNNVKNSNLESVLVSIKLLMDHEDFAKARTMIDEHHKFIGHDARLLTLEINLSLIEKRFFAAVESLVLARKQKSITELTLSQWEEKAFYGAFEQQLTEKNEDELARYWNNFSKKIKQRETVVMAYCLVLAKHNIITSLNKILLPVIKKGANKSFLMAMRSLPLQKPEELITAVQKHLQKDPHNALWLSCLAHLAVSSKQFDMAEKAFNSLVNLSDTPYDKIDLLAFAQTLQQCKQYEKAAQVYAKLH